jgi:hypothetical protein
MVSATRFTISRLNEISEIYVLAYDPELVDQWLKEERRRLASESPTGTVDEYDLAHTLKNRAFYHHGQLALRELEEKREE